MALTVQTQLSGDVFILDCNGRIISGDECAFLRERVVNMLPGTPNIVVNLEGVDHIDSDGLGMLVGLLVSARNRSGELKLASPRKRVADLLRRTLAPPQFTNSRSISAQEAWAQILHSASCLPRLTGFSGSVRGPTSVFASQTSSDPSPSALKMAKHPHNVTNGFRAQIPVNNNLLVTD